VIKLLIIVIAIGFSSLAIPTEAEQPPIVSEITTQPITQKDENKMEPIKEVLKETIPEPAPVIVPQQIAPKQPTVAGTCDIAYNNIMRAICLAESSGNPNAVGDNYVIAGLYAPSCGLWQIRTLKGRPTCEELKNPQTNLDWAWKISNQGTNWNPWTVYTNGKYLKFL